MPKSKSGPQVDLSFARAARLMPPAYERLRILLVGCGGTGSWLAPSVARIAKVVEEKGSQAQVTFCDHDHVEQKNIPRQNFCQAELGRNKAATLAARFSAAWGVRIDAAPKRFSAVDLRSDYQALTLLVGCVDNAAGRREMARALESLRERELARVWWLDCGNAESSGQVLIGSELAGKDLAGAFTASRKICRSLPAPSLVAPDLLVAKPEEMAASKRSCAEIQLADDQSLAVNQMVASVATDYLLRFCFGGLKRFATYFDLESGSMRSRYITPEEIAGVIRRPAEFLVAPAKRK